METKATKAVKSNAKENQRKKKNLSIEVKYFEFNEVMF